MNGVDQVGIDFLRNVIAIERHFQNGRVLAHAGIENIFVYIGIQRSRNRVLLLAIGFVHGFESTLANFAVRTLQELNIVAVRELDFLAVLVLIFGNFMSALFSMPKMVCGAEERLPT